MSCSAFSGMGFSMIGHVADWDLCAIKVRLCAANVAHRPKASGRRCAVIKIRCSIRCTRSPASSTPGRVSRAIEDTARLAGDERGIDRVQAESRQQGRASRP